MSTFETNRSIINGFRELTDKSKISDASGWSINSASSPKPTTGIKKVLYIDEDTGDMFIWDGSGYVAL